MLFFKAGGFWEKANNGINISERIGLWILGKWKGEEIAEKKKMELTDPKRMRKIGFQALFMGIALLAVAVITYL
jgi:hypothetical protein